MRALVQRVTRAEVRSRIEPDGVLVPVGAIAAGLCVLVGVTHSDSGDAARALARKVAGLRVFDDDDGVMNLAAPEVGAGFLVVSQFTLYGSTDRGRRPSWVDAARPEVAEPLVGLFVAALREIADETGAVVETGRFRTEMEVELVNDGPVTLVVEA
ncbi:D-aminoacyl-tRNA deacylase [Ilumatobacter sp.]|uniref:D-aminoacyl-tRNA deacylase n=1 Tax=Ilumatobacter sp. TaxID=1967498 RepID=UPI003B527D31